MVPDTNIKFDVLEWWSDPSLPYWNTIYKWFLGGEQVHSITVTADDLSSMYPHRSCPACLMHRGKLVVASARHGNYEMCPECMGILVPQMVCSCAEIPHRVSCPMGFGHYFVMG